ncbi:ABC transporter permease [Spirochaeta cellobiosiphila]|uniref:ABC transporter permease n=1 Tax=Spirochaeta cellobiosiphila TaxID=504483 RepID=UPI00041E3A20|nr:FtsX-like permease family protein [Spirochaeta cellobiosiphila]
MKNIINNLRLGFKPIADILKGTKKSKNLKSAFWGIVLSVIPIVVVLLVSDGMIFGITKRYIETSLYHFQIRSFRSKSIEDMELELSQAFDGEDWFKSGWFEHQSTGMLFNDLGKTVGFIRGVDPLWYEKDAGLRDYLQIKSGSFDLSKNNDIVLGQELASKLNLKVGDSVKLSTLKKISSQRYLPKITSFHVTGIVSTGYRELDKLWLFISFDESISIIGKEQGTVLYGLKVRNPQQDLMALTYEVNSQLPSGYGAYSWYNLGYSQFKNFETTQILLLFIMAVIIAVAAINISSSLIMIVIEDTKEIAILRSLGASPTYVKNKYLMTGCGIGFLGSLVGLALGLLIGVNINFVISLLEGSINIVSAVKLSLSQGQLILPHVNWGREYYLEKIPTVIHIYKLLGIFFFANILAFISTSFPAQKAANLKPVDILHRH